MKIRDNVNVNFIMRQFFPLKGTLYLFKHSLFTARKHSLRKDNVLHVSVILSMGMCAWHACPRYPCPPGTHTPWHTWPLGMHTLPGMHTPGMHAPWPPGPLAPLSCIPTPPPILRDALNETAVRILLECILVYVNLTFKSL